MTTVDRTIASIGLPYHPHPRVIAETVARIGDKATAAISMAALLAAQGWGTSTLGDGGSRSTDTTSTTERAATRDFHSRWENAPHHLATLLAQLAKTATEADNLIADLLQHAQDLDPVPVGTGECQACGRFCRPDKARPGNRLRSGLCPTDHRAWLRAGKPERNVWVRTKRTDLTDEHGVLHTPEPDHDIDLTSEVLVTPRGSYVAMSEG